LIKTSCYAAMLLLMGCAAHTAFMDKHLNYGCEQARRVVAMHNSDTLRVRCEEIYVDIHATPYILCPVGKEGAFVPRLGCCRIFKRDNKTMALITIATNQDQWRRTIEHEYCHALLGTLNDPEWITFCHNYYGR